MVPEGSFSFIVSVVVILRFATAGIGAFWQFREESPNLS